MLSYIDMDGEPEDNPITTAAIGLLAYASADIAHHALGHGGACLALGGSIISLSSVFVDCSLRGAAIDLSGPLMNLVLGIIAVLAARIATRASASTRLFWILAAAFNLLWFEMQLVFSVAAKTDDWAWAIHQYQVPDPLRYGIIAIGAFAYLITVRFIALQMGSYAHSAPRVRRIVLIAWLTAGATACATAALDHNAIVAILRHALPQAILLPIGLLFVPSKAARLSVFRKPASVIAFSVPWTIAAALVCAASIVLLGSGVAVTT